MSTLLTTRRDSVSVSPSNYYGLKAALGLALATMVAMGCSSDPPRELVTQLAVTDNSIAQAEQAGAAQGGLPDLQKAKDKRVQAEKALNDRKYDQSMQLAQQAQLDAQYASTQARAKGTMRQAAEATRSNDVLRGETERNLEDAAKRE